MSTRPRFDSLDTGSLDQIKDLATARLALISERSQHALMSGYGGPPQCRSCYITATTTVSYRVPPGVTEVNVAALVAADGGNDDCTILFTTSVDAVGTEFPIVGGDDSDVAAASWRKTNGVLDSADVGAESGRALTVRSSAVWTWDDVDVVITVTAAATDVVIYALMFSPVHVPR